MKRKKTLIVSTICVLIILLHLTGAKAAETGTESGSETYTYKVGINDVIDIAVLGNPNLKTVSSVSSDGTITFPYIGAVYVKDLNLSEIREEITKRLSDGYVKYPVVTVSLIRSMSRKIFTYGQLGRRGEIPFEEDLILLKAISLAGGISGEGLFGKVIIRRRQKESHKYKEILEADLNNGMIESKKTENVLLQPDDILIVERSRTFLIQGEVMKRGRFVLEKGMTVVRALLQAGGVNENGKYGKIKVRRKQKGKGGEYKDLVEAKLNEGAIESRKVEDTQLQPDDILIVERSRTYLIQGEVMKRGRFPLEEGMTVMRALLQAGGVSDKGKYGKIKVRRKQEGEGGEYKDLVEAKLNEGAIESREVEDTQLQPDDILIVERSKTFLIQGEVTKRGRIPLEKGMTVMRALLEAGGVNENGKYGKIKVRRKQEGEGGEYKDLVEAKLNEGAIESREVEDTQLQPDDILIVERSKTFFIYGEVNKKGEFILKKDMTVFRAITIAGGFTKWGSESRVKILRRADSGTGFETIKVDIGDVIKGDATADINLQPGDTIIVSTGVF